MTLALRSATRSTLRHGDLRALNKAVILTDTGTGSDASPITALASSDSVVGSDVSSLAAASSASDSGAGTQTSALAVTLSTIDTSAGTDTSSGIALALSDSGAGSDTSRIDLAVHDENLHGVFHDSFSDVYGEYGDNVVSLAVAASTSDAATGTDAEIVRAMDAVDDAVAADALTARDVELVDNADSIDVVAEFANALESTEPASGVDEVISSEVVLSASDVSSGTDAAAVAVTLAGSEASTGADVRTAQTAAIAHTEAASGQDTRTALTAAVSAHDENVRGVFHDGFWDIFEDFGEEASLQALSSSSDAATGSEVSGVPDIAYNVNDSAHGSERSRRRSHTTKPKVHPRRRPRTVLIGPNVRSKD